MSKYELKHQHFFFFLKVSSVVPKHAALQNEALVKWMRTFGAASKICITYLKQGLALVRLYGNSSEKRVCAQWKPSTLIAPSPFSPKKTLSLCVMMDIHSSSNLELSFVPPEKGSFVLAITALWCNDGPVLPYGKGTPSGDCGGGELHTELSSWPHFPPNSAENSLTDEW